MLRRCRSGAIRDLSTRTFRLTRPAGEQFRGLAWDQRAGLLQLAWRLGMMLHVSANGSRLHNPRILELLAACPPYRITVSAYGATEASYDALVRRPGAFRLFSRCPDATSVLDWR